MHISAINIENYRCFRSVQLTNLPTAVVFLGENNAGKSNLLSALRLVLDPSISDRQRMLDVDDFWSGCTAPLAGDEIRVDVHLSGFEDDQRVKAALRDSCVSDGPLTARLTYVYRPGPQSDGTDGDYEARVFGGDDESNELTSSRRKEVALTVLPALRDADGDLQHPYRSPLNELLRLAEVDDAALEDVAAAIRDANARLLQEPELKELESAITDRVRAMVGQTHAIDVELGVNSPLPAEVLRAVRVLVEGGFHVRRTGLGASNVLYLALLLQRLETQRQKNRLASSILAVEEPEAHLHPHVQRVLFAALLRDTSVIVTTHSAHIASVSRLASLVMLQRVRSGLHVETAAFRALDEAMTPDQRADLERYLDVNRADLLFARGVVLVEGAAERYLVPSAAAAVGIDLDELGISVCSVEGTDFAPYRLLLNALQVPHVVITDGDKRPTGELAGLDRGIRLLPEAARLEATDLRDSDAAVREFLAEHGIFVNGSTLEVEYSTTAPEGLQAAYDELVSSETKRQRMAKDIANAGAGARDLDQKLADRIAAQGKGRFAQRAAAHLTSAEHPAYLTDAVEWLQSKLED